MKMIVCTICKTKFPDSIFHVETQSGHVFCESCLFKAMAEKRKVKE